MKIDRKAAIAAYRQQKPDAGIYAIHCDATALIWLGQTGNLASVRSRQWFGLRMGSHSNRDMQSAWTSHGEASFRFETIEILPEESNQIVRAALLRDRLKYWRERLGAPAA